MARETEEEAEVLAVSGQAILARFVNGDERARSGFERILGILCPRTY